MVVMRPIERAESAGAIVDGDVAEPTPAEKAPEELVEAIEPETGSVMEETGEQQWVLLWSRSEGALHKVPLIDAMAKGLAMLKGELEADDHTLLYVGTRAAVEAMAAELSPRVAARAEADEALGLRNGPVR
jgi:hypothetical protein